LTIIFENSFTNWTAEWLELTKATLLYDRESLALMLHSVPDLTIIETATTLRQLLAVSYSIWLTGTSNYTEFDGVLPVFIGSLATLLN
jgi:hypothetical protein